MLRKISDKVLDFFGFFEENQDVSFMIGGIALIIVLIIVFIGLRAKMRNQEKVLQKARIGEEKYRILAEISNDILFEYDIFSDRKNISALAITPKKKSSLKLPNRYSFAFSLRSSSGYEEIIFEIALGTPAPEKSKSRVYSGKTI